MRRKKNICYENIIGNKKSNVLGIKTNKSKTKHIYFDNTQISNEYDIAERVSDYFVKSIKYKKKYKV